MSAFAIVGARIFDGAAMRDGQGVVVESGRVRDVCKLGALPSGIARREVEGLLAPGFIDIQVNGGGGVLFNDAPTVEGIRAIGAAHRRFGTTGFLPTLITDTREKMAAAIEAVRAGIEAGVPGLLGVHIEGPFLNPARKGVHDPKYMRPIEEEDIRILTSLGAGRTLVTLAPEMVPLEAIARLVEAGVVVSAGHTAASYEEMAAARAAGLRGVTHLFNAMPHLENRNPGPVGAALDDAALCPSIIADLHHVAAPVLRAAIRAMGTARTILITDAMSTVGTDMTDFALQGRTIHRRDGRLTTDDGTLAGSDLDMATAVRNTATHLGVSIEDALRMASLVPAKFLRLDAEIGKIAPGCRASFVLLDDAMRATRIWIDGEEKGRAANLLP